jgi:hypothetical protein
VRFDERPVAGPTFELTRESVKAERRLHAKAGSHHFNGLRPTRTPRNVGKGVRLQELRGPEGVGLATKHLRAPAQTNCGRHGQTQRLYLLKCLIVLEIWQDHVRPVRFRPQPPSD